MKRTIQLEKEPINGDAELITKPYFYTFGKSIVNESIDTNYY